MRLPRTTCLFLGLTGVLALAYAFFLFFFLSYLSASDNLPASVYLEACRSEILPWRATKCQERQYKFYGAPEEIDVVYTWVNGSDPAHQAVRNRFLRLEGLAGSCNDGNGAEKDCVDATTSRFADHDELKYSLRSLHEFAPWIRNVYIVTNGQVPNWLNTSHPRVRIVTHEQIFKWPEHLPTFNSIAIEANLHRIPGLSEHFLYFNDDMLLSDYIYPSTFYTQQDGQKLWFYWPLPQHPSIAETAPPRYDRSQKCPKCECEPCQSGEYRCPKSYPPHLATPYYMDEVIDGDPPEPPHFTFRQMDTAAKSGMDFLPHEFYPWEKFPEETPTPEATNDEGIGTGRKELSTSTSQKISSDKVHRKLLGEDSVRQSLLKTHKMMHEEFGYAYRMEPAHVPLYIQKPVLERLQARWPDEHFAQSSHRFRNPTDMHFQFSYSYYLIHERRPFNFSNIFAQMDTDHSLVLETPELQRLATIVMLGLYKRGNPYRSPPLATDFAKMLVEDCAWASSRLPHLYASRSDLETCTNAMYRIFDWYQRKLNNRFMYASAEADSSFVMVGRNPELKRELDFALLKEPKFICLNDDINYDDEAAATEYLRLVGQFLQTLYPRPSPFELQP